MLLLAVGACHAASAAAAAAAAVSSRVRCWLIMNRHPMVSSNVQLLG
jgi:hypothetical protein